MPKIKTHRGAAKRFEITKTGKIKRRHASGNHLLEKKSASRKRRYQGVVDVAAADRRDVRRLLGR